MTSALFQRLAHQTHLFLSTMASYVEDRDHIPPGDPDNPVIFLLTPDGIVASRLKDYLQKRTAQESSVTS